MTNESNSGPKGAEGDDPLSATAMFFRALDKQAAGELAEPAAKSDFGALAIGGQDVPPARPQSGSDKGEFTAIFGSRDAASTPAPPSAPPQPALGEAFRPARSEEESAAKQGQGEFTSIFVKGVSSAPEPAARVTEPAPEATPPRLKGFSSPGVSDAASAQTSFSRFFKPAPNAAAPVQPVQLLSVEAFRPETPRLSSTDPFRTDAPFGNPSKEPISSGQDPQSITNLIQSLSPQASSGGGSRVSEPAPYRSSESQPPIQPAAKPPAPPEFEAGGVTQFIHRLAEMLPAPAVETPSAPSIRKQGSGPGEYTRIVSAPTRLIASSPAVSAASPSSTPAAPPSTPAFVRPVVPVMPVVPPIPPSIASHPAPMPTMQPIGLPAPHLPPTPAPLAVATPKGKLEALVPMLLVVNTFLLVVILVVMIFLIKSR